MQLARRFPVYSFGTSYKFTPIGLSLRSFILITVLMAGVDASAPSPSGFTDQLPDAPSYTLLAAANPPAESVSSSSSDSSDPFSYSFYPAGQENPAAAKAAKDSDKG